jgi:biotin carboxyl carrier protein
MKLRITLEGRSYEVDVEILDDVTPYTPSTPRPASPVSTSEPLAHPQSSANTLPADDEKSVRSPIAGVVLRVDVSPGDRVEINQVVMIMEAMKMETNIASPVAGTVRTVHVKNGEAVKQGQLLVEYE